MFPWLKKAIQKSANPDTCSAVTPEEDMAIAQAAMAQGDLKHSAFHVGAALTTDPNRAEWLEFLNRLLTIAPDPLTLAPMEEQNYAGTIAVRAYILSHLGRFNGADGALNLLAQAALAKTDTPYLDWLIQWLEAPENVGKLDLQHLANLTGQGDTNTRDQRFYDLFHDPAAKPFVSRLPRVAVAAIPHQTDQNPLSVLLVRILRQNGLAAEAITVAEAVHANAPGYFSAISLATTYKENNEIDKAIPLYEEAHRYDPTDEAVMLDLGDTYLQIGHLASASRWYRGALNIEPEQPWARPSLLAIQVLQAGSDKEARLGELEQYIEMHPDNQRARMMIRSLYYPYYESYLPEPQEATINVVKQVLTAREEGKTFEPGKKVTLSLSQLECASAVRAVRSELEEKIQATLELTIQHIATPDPRKPTGGNGFALWRYEGNEATPGVPEAHNDAATAAIREITALPYIFSAWVYKAKALAPTLENAAVPALLWTMVSPPGKADSELPWWTWMFRVQVATALLLAFREPGWQGTRRRVGLLALLQGPVDWSVSAAIIALVAVAQNENNPAVTSEIRREFQKLRRAQPDQGYCCWLPVVLLGMIELPGTSREEATALWNAYRELD